MINQYATDADFVAIWNNLKSGGTHLDYSLSGYLLMENRICVSAPLQQKVLMESHAPPYAIHRGKAGVSIEVQNPPLHPCSSIDGSE